MVFCLRRDGMPEKPKKRLNEKEMAVAVKTVVEQVILCLDEVDGVDACAVMANVGMNLINMGMVGVSKGTSLKGPEKLDLFHKIYRGFVDVHAKEMKEHAPDVFLKFRLDLLEGSRRDGTERSGEPS